MLHAASRLLAVVGWALLLTGTATAADAVDLSDLHAAIKTASKRGDNVDEVKKAVEAVEKLLAKGWTAPKPDAAPPAELTALRDAVEAAGRKGENVEDIRKELDTVEKALLGRTLVAMKPELPPLGTLKPEPEPDLGFGRRGGIVVRGGGRVVVGGGNVVIGGGGRAGSSFSISISNGNFTIKATQGEVRYEITGQTGGDGPEAAKILITDGEKKIEVEGLKKVPEEYRPLVERYLKMVR